MSNPPNVYIPRPVCEMADLTAFERLLYGWIHTRCLSTGVCQDTNAELAATMNCTPRHIIRSLWRLRNRDLLRVEAVRVTTEGTERTSRILRVLRPWETE